MSLGEIMESEPEERPHVPRDRRGAAHPRRRATARTGRPSASADQALIAARRRLADRLRESERRYVRALARRYRRQRHLDRLMGWGLVLPTPSDARLTRRLIRALGHLLHDQITRNDPSAQRQARRTRIALFGECGRWQAERRCSRRAGSSARHGRGKGV